LSEKKEKEQDTKRRERRKELREKLEGRVAKRTVEQEAMPEPEVAEAVQPAPSTRTGPQKLGGANHTVIRGWLG
jgi:hypothetical protein